MPTSAQQSMATIDQFLQKVGSVKAADDPLSEPGSIGGDTSHPVKNVDDRLQNVSEGERSSENSSDVKEDQGAPSVENAPEAKAASARINAGRLAKGQGLRKRAEGAVMSPGSAADDAEESVLNVQPTGEDPSNETNSAKGGKEDPGSDHPARTDNDSLDGHKYAFDTHTPLEKMAGMFKDLGENLCAQIAWMSNNPQTQQQATKRAGAQQAPQQKQAGYDDAQLAAQAGWELAGLLNGTMDKAAADRMVANTIEEIIKTASDDADRTAAYFGQYFPQLFKQAEGEDGGDPSGGGGGPPPGGDPSGGGGGGPSEEEMMAMLGGGAPAGDGGGGGPGGDPSGGGGGGGGPEEEAAQLAQVLEQLGVSPEELEQAMAQEAGGGAGGPPPGGDPMGGGMPPGGPPPGGPGGAPPGMEVAASDRFGRGRHNQPHQGEKVAQMRQYISEVIQRSRARR